jgi:Putative zinc-finger
MSAHMPLDCDGFAAKLADYLEGDAPDAVRAAVESHAAECVACGQLLEDLRSIQHEAAALPALVPSRDLWAGIAERIDARVIPLERPARTVLPARQTWARPAIAAAALVVATAGITYYTTRVTMTTTSAPVAPQVVAITPAPETTPDSVGRAASSPTTPGLGTAIEPTTPRVASTRPVGSPARLVSAVPLMRETEPVYDREMLKLRTIMKTRRSQLDPKTVAVLEQSISVIDSAIAQSRAALAKDPASGFLANQLNHSLEKKVELLRTAALLPART